PALSVDSLSLVPFGRSPNRLELGLCLRFLDKADHAAAPIHAEDAQPRSRSRRYRKCSNGNVGLAITMSPDELSKVHPVELIAGKDEDFRRAVVLNVARILAHSVGRALVPVRSFIGLLSRQDFHKALTERVKLVSIGDMAVQTDTEKLRQNINPVQAAVDA